MISWWPQPSPHPLGTQQCLTKDLRRRLIVKHIEKWSVVISSTKSSISVKLSLLISHTTAALTKRDQEAQRCHRRYIDLSPYHHHHHPYQYAALHKHNKYAYQVFCDVPLPVIPPPQQCAPTKTMDCVYVVDMRLAASYNLNILSVRLCEDICDSHSFPQLLI